MTIFPMYGLVKTQDHYKSQAYASIGTSLEKADNINKEYFAKMDHIKRYNEEMLKCSDMRMKKK